MPKISPQDVKAELVKFGLNPTDAEIASLGNLTSGYGGEEAIAQYALTKTAQKERQAKDPLNAVLVAEKTFTTAMQAAAAGDKDAAEKLFGQLGDLLKQAPKLFGSMTPDQVDQYIAPLTQQFKTADAAVQGSAAARGLAGSSTELNAEAEQSRLFKEGVLSTGLSVGMTQQQAQAKAISDEIARRTSMYGTETSAALSGFGLQNQAAGQLSGQDYNESSLLASLPSYLRAQVLQELTARKALEKKDGLGDTLGKINGVINTVKNVGSVVFPFMGAPPPTPGTGNLMGTGQPVPAAPSFAPGAGSTLLPPSLSLIPAAL